MQESVQSINYLWIVIPIVIMAVFFLGSLMWLIVVRKQLKVRESGCGAPFTLEQIRDMKNQGTLSQQEYVNLRNMIIQDIVPDCGMVAGLEDDVDRGQEKGGPEEDKGDTWRDNGISE